MHAAVPGAPQSVKISSTTLSTISLTWSPPLLSERHGLAIFGYVVNCSTDHSFRLGNAVNYAESFNATLINLHPFTAYNCCVAVSSNHGRGRLSCQIAVTWDQSMLIFFGCGYHDIDAMHTDVDDQCSSVNPHNQGQLTLSLASLLGLILFVLLILIVASTYISYRLYKRDKKVARYL